MKAHAEVDGEPVGCFFLLRRDNRMPVLTAHRVTRAVARELARSLVKTGRMGLGYDVVGLDHVCDCRGRAVLERGIDVVGIPRRHAWQVVLAWFGVDV